MSVISASNCLRIVLVECTRGDPMMRTMSWFVDQTNPIISACKEMFNARDNVTCGVSVRPTQEKIDEIQKKFDEFMRRLEDDGHVVQKYSEEFSAGDHDDWQVCPYQISEGIKVTGRWINDRLI
jgi:hypothetical protein